MIKRRLLLLSTICFVSWLFITIILIRNRPDGISLRHGQSADELAERLNNVDKEIGYQVSLVNKLSQKLDALLKDEDNIQIGVLVIACNRPTVDRALSSLLKYRADKNKFPIVVSQDCGDYPTKEAILKFGDEISYIEQPDTSNIPLNPSEVKFSGYFKISRHYKFALNYMFGVLKFKAVIVTEDDLDISEDFYNYFEATYPLLIQDKTLMCASAWNDNGKINLIDRQHPEILYRSDFFPGLGWMLTSELWDELKNDWPRGFWDDWMRLPETRKERSCIRPEISRTRTFGKIGVSLGQFYETHLKHIVLNTKPVKFQSKDLNFLLKKNYDSEFLAVVYGAKPVSVQAVLQNKITTSPVRITYNSKETFQQIAKALGLMNDFKSGVPRTAYKGIVTAFIGNTRIYISPPKDWRVYDPSW